MKMVSLRFTTGRYVMGAVMMAAFAGLSFICVEHTRWFAYLTWASQEVLGVIHGLTILVVIPAGASAIGYVITGAWWYPPMIMLITTTLVTVLYSGTMSYSVENVLLGLIYAVAYLAVSLTTMGAIKMVEQACRLVRLWRTRR